MCPLAYAYIIYAYIIYMEYTYTRRRQQRNITQRPTTAEATKSKLKKKIEKIFKKVLTNAKMCYIMNMQAQQNTLKNSRLSVCA